jgi:hypothetical protein
MSSVAIISCGELGLEIRDAGRVRRAVDDHQAGLRGDRRLELFGGDLEIGLHAAGDDHRSGTGEQHHVRVGDPVRSRHDHLVARVEQRLGEIEEALLAATRDQDLLGAVVEAVVPLELVDHRLLQRRGAADRGILGHPRADRLDGRILDVLRGVEVGLAGSQADDVLALGLELIGTGGDRESR